MKELVKTINSTAKQLQHSKAQILPVRPYPIKAEITLVLPLDRINLRHYNQNLTLLSPEVDS